MAPTVFQLTVTQSDSCNQLLRQFMLRRSAQDASFDMKSTRSSFSGRGKMRPDDAEVARLRRELAKTKTSQEGPVREYRGLLLSYTGYSDALKGRW